MYYNILHLLFFTMYFKVARVHPMVPEVSVFSHYSNPESRQPLRPVNEAPSKSRLRNAEKSRTEDSLCRTVPIKKPPRPEMPPVRLDFKPSDISKYVKGRYIL